MEYSSTIIKRSTDTQNNMMDLKSIILSERTQTKRYTLYTTILDIHWHSGNDKIIQTMVSRDWEWK